jgi:hypothetical protein
MPRPRFHSGPAAPAALSRPPDALLILRPGRPAGPPDAEHPAAAADCRQQQDAAGHGHRDVPGQDARHGQQHRAADYGGRDQRPLPRLGLDQVLPQGLPRRHQLSVCITRPGGPVELPHDGPGEAGRRLVPSAASGHD